MPRIRHRGSGEGEVTRLLPEFIEGFDRLREHMPAEALEVFPEVLEETSRSSRIKHYRPVTEIHREKGKKTVVTGHKKRRRAIHSVRSGEPLTDEFREHMVDRILQAIEPIALTLSREELRLLPDLLQASDDHYRRLDTGKK